MKCVWQAIRGRSQIGRETQDVSSSMKPRKHEAISEVKQEVKAGKSPWGMEKSTTGSLCRLHVTHPLSESSLFPHSDINEVPGDLAISHRTWSFSQLVCSLKIRAYHSIWDAWEMQVSDIYDCCLHAIHCLFEKIWKQLNIATRKLGGTNHYFCSITTMIIRPSDHMSLKLSSSVSDDLNSDRKTRNLRK